MSSYPWLHGLVAAVAPRPCAGCRGSGGPWCRACAATLAGPVKLADLRPVPEGLPPVLARAAYAGPLREALVAFKDHGRWSLRAPLGAALAVPVAALLFGSGRQRAVLVPVAASPGAVRARRRPRARARVGRRCRVAGVRGRRAGRRCAHRRTSAPRPGRTRARGPCGQPRRLDAGGGRVPATRRRRPRRRPDDHRVDPGRGGPRAAVRGGRAAGAAVVAATRTVDLGGPRRGA